MVVFLYDFERGIGGRTSSTRLRPRRWRIGTSASSAPNAYFVPPALHQHDHRQGVQLAVA